MNIFYLHPDPVMCAQYHGNKHVVKMISEYTQILSTAHHCSGTTLDVALICKATHPNHPSNLWVRDSRANYLWLHKLLVALCAEYTHRYGKYHLYERDGRIALLAKPPRSLPNIPQTALRLAVPDHYKSLPPLKAYRAFYANEKYAKDILVWRNRKMPPFLKQFGFNSTEELV
jgi:hypothetical protein